MPGLMCRQNIHTLLAMRLFAGFFGSPALAVGGATMGDVRFLLSVTPLALTTCPDVQAETSRLRYRRLGMWCCLRSDPRSAHGRLRVSGERLDMDTLVCLPFQVTRYYADMKAGS